MAVIQTNLRENVATNIKKNIFVQPLLVEKVVCPPIFCFLKPWSANSPVIFDKRGFCTLLGSSSYLVEAWMIMSSSSGSSSITGLKCERINKSGLIKKKIL